MPGISKEVQGASGGDVCPPFEPSFSCGYAAAKVLFDAIGRCGKDISWACTITEVEKTKNLDTGVMTPISFGPGVRFSNQKLKIMQAEFTTLSYKPVN